MSDIVFERPLRITNLDDIAQKVGNAINIYFHAKVGLKDIKQRIQSSDSLKSLLQQQGFNAARGDFVEITSIS